MVVIQMLVEVDHKVLGGARSANMIVSQTKEDTIGDVARNPIPDMVQTDTKKRGFMSLMQIVVIRGL